MPAHVLVGGGRGGRGQRRRAIAFAVALIALGFNAVPSAKAAGPTVGDTYCPHGYDAYTAAAQACYYGTVMYQTHARLPGNPYISTEQLDGREYAKFKLSLFSGSPCSAYLEGGLIGRGPASVTDYGPYYEWRKTNGEWNRIAWAGVGPWGTGHTLDIFWYQGAGSTTFGASYDGFRPATPDLLLVGFGNGACITEAGLFIATSKSNDFRPIYADPMDISELVSYDAGTGAVHAGWNRAVHDRPCGQVALGQCLHGTYYGSRVWSSNKP